MQIGYHKGAGTKKHNYLIGYRSIILILGHNTEIFINAPFKDLINFLTLQNLTKFDDFDEVQKAL